MRYKNVAGRFFKLVTKHACDRQTDSLNRVPASAGVKAGMSPLPGGR